MLSRRLTMIGGAALALTVLHLLSGTLGGCGATGGQRISLGTRVVAAEGITAPLVNEYGWSVTLTKARLSVGELYYFSGPPVVASWERFLAIPRAHAHPGHYTEGDALGQMIEPDTVDLLTETALADAEAVTGRYESARFSFESPPPGARGEEMDGNVVWIEGEAEKGTTVVRFRATALVEDVLNTEDDPFVEGCVFEAVDIEGPGTVTLTVHPGVWLDQVDFGQVPDGLDADRVDLAPGQAPHKAFVRGLKKGTAYGFAYAPDEP